MKKAYSILLLAIVLLHSCGKEPEQRQKPPPFGPPTAVEWTAIIGEPGLPGESLLHTSDNHVIVSGARNDDALVFKADTGCRITWEITVGDYSSETALKTVETINGNYVTLVSRNSGNVSSDQTFFLYYISSQGVITDSLAVSHSAMNYAVDIEAGLEGEVYVCGLRVSDGLDQNYSSSWTLIKATDSKSTSWKKQFEEKDAITLLDLGIDPDGDIHIAASSAYDDKEIILFRLSPTGKMLSEDYFLTDYNEAISFDIHCTRVFGGYNPFEPDRNAYLKSYDMQGGLVWERTYQANPTDSSFNPIRCIHPTQTGFIAFGSAIYLNSLVNAMSDMTGWITVFGPDQDPDWHVVWIPQEVDKPCNFLINSVEYVGDGKCILLGEGILGYPCADEDEIFIIPVNSEGFIYPTTPLD